MAGTMALDTSTETGRTGRRNWTATSALLVAAYVSLPLLLVAVCWAGIATGRLEPR